MSLAALAQAALRTPRDRIMRDVVIPPTSPTPRESFSIGVHIGVGNSPSALAVLHCLDTKDAQGKRLRLWDCLCLDRFDPGTPYTEIISTIQALFADEKLERQLLALNVTEAGHEIGRQFPRAGIKAHFVPIIISGTETAMGKDGAFAVPARELVATLRVLLETPRPGGGKDRLLRVAENVPLAKSLADQFQRFTARVSSALNPVAPWTAGPDESALLALAVGLFAGQHFSRRLSIAL